MSRGQVTEQYDLRIREVDTLLTLKRRLVEGGLSYLQVSRMRPYDESRLGTWKPRTGVVSARPDAEPQWILHGDDPNLSLAQCGFYDHCNLMVTDGRRD